MSISSIGGTSSFDPAQMAKSFFKKADANGDGGIDKSELKTMLSQGPGAGKGAQDIDKIFAKVDTDGSGAISATENEAQTKKMGAQGGKPPGGAPPAGGQKPGASSGSAQSGTTKTYDKKDTNKDGTVSSQEEFQYDLVHPSVSYNDQGNENSLKSQSQIDLTA